jgi:hypothetical protein
MSCPARGPAVCPATALRGRSAAMYRSCTCTRRIRNMGAARHGDEWCVDPCSRGIEDRPCSEAPLPHTSTSMRESRTHMVSPTTKPMPVPDALGKHAFVRACAPQTLPAAYMHMHTKADWCASHGLAYTRLSTAHCSPLQQHYMRTPRRPHMRDCMLARCQLCQGSRADRATG